MARVRRAFGWMLIGLLLLVVVIGALGLALVQSQPGHDFLLRTAVRQLTGYIDGRVEVGAIRSDGILRGFSLHDISIHGLDGRPFAEIDSLQLRYSARDLLARELVLVPVRVWRPRITIETLPPDSVSNVVRIFASDPGEPDEAAPSEHPDEAVGAAFRLALRGVEVYDGTFTLRLPLSGDGIPGGVTEVLSEGAEPLQLLRFTRIDARIADADILNPERAGQRIQFDRLSLVGEVLGDPFELADFRGEVESTPGQVLVSADRLWFPGTEAAGTLRLDLSDPDDFGLEVALEVPVLDLADFRWLEPRLPDGSGRLDLDLVMEGGETRLRVEDMDVRSGENRIRGSGGLDLGRDPDDFRVAATRVELLPFDLSALEDWLPEPLPVEGRFTGLVEVSGYLRALAVEGDLVGEVPGSGFAPLAARFAGTAHLGEDLGVTDLILSLDDLDYAGLGAWVPDLAVTGTGRVELLASGSRASGFDIRGEVDHRALGEVDQWSRLRVEGTVREEGEDLRLDLATRLEPLSLDGIDRSFEFELPVTGELSGAVSLQGLLSALTVDLDVETPAGRILATGEFDARDPVAGYRVEGSVEDFRLSALVAEVPDSTIVSGRFLVDASGIDLESVSGSAEVEFLDSWLAAIPVDRLAVRLLASGGRLRVEELDLTSPVLILTGTGELPLREGEPEGEIRVEWDASSLTALRPILFGDDPIASDTLTSLERQILVAQGVDPDTLGLTTQIDLDGRMEGEATLRGTVGNLRADGTITFEDVVYGGFALGQAGGTVSASLRDGELDAVAVVATLDDLTLDGFEFEQGEARVEYGRGEGAFGVSLRSGDGEVYMGQGTFALDSLGFDVQLAEMSVDLGDVVWALEGPVAIRVADSSARIDGLRIARPGIVDGDVVRIEVDGIIDLDGESDLVVRADGVDLDRVAIIAQTDLLPSGVLSLELRVHGPATAPLIDGEFGVAEFGFNGTSLSMVSGTLDYANRRMEVRVTGMLDGETLLVVDGMIPVDLAFGEVETRFPAEEIDLLVSVEELPAATVLAFLDMIEDVRGSLDGEVRFRGRPDDLRPSGEIVLRGGSGLLSEIGIRLTGIDADFTLREDGTLEIAGVVQSRGSARVSGTLDLSDLSNPGFDLSVNAAGFQAVDRRDLAARIGGEIVLLGSMNAPRVEGVVRVEQGELFLEEFARTAEVIDLSDPAFFDVVDTSFVAVRPAVEAAQNPFIQNLRVDVDLSLQRDFWLRSREINVEIAGDLAVLFERSEREILLVGTLEPLRGTYSTFGRQFQVDGGSVDFAGTPGVNPTLNINAVTRLRREGGEPLTIFAHVGGTLMAPRVNLTTDSQPPIAESDLISYLLFGRPSYALASAETTTLQGAVGAGVSRMTGTIASQLGSVVGRQIGLDYFSITQGDDPGGIGSAAGLSGSFVQTQIEVGQYLGPNLFLAVVLRPLGGLQGGGQAQLPGARIEWRFTDAWSMEGFVEDRFAREGASGFGELGLRLSKIFGLFLYRDWGY